MDNNTETEARAEQIRQTLRARGGTYAVADYDGYGDSGGIETVQVLTTDNAPTSDPVEHTPATPPLDLPAEEDTQLQEVFYDLLETRFNGWENDAGAFGQFVWDLRTNQLNHVHHARFEDYDTTELDGWPSEAESAATAEAADATQEEG